MIRSMLFLVCDGRGSNGVGCVNVRPADPGDDPITNRANAQRAGWVNRSGKDLCPGCAVDTIVHSVLAKHRPSATCGECAPQEVTP